MRGVMSSTRSLTPLDASQYDAIEDAVRETERGRWFLTEYARRNRNADTGVLLDAIRRIETVVTADRGDDVGRFRGDLMEMADAIARTRAEVAALSQPDHGESRLTVASEALDAIVRATERATSDILSAAEEVQEAAWTLREGGADSELCDALDRHATQIYTACSFQDLTAQRTSRVVHTLRYLEDRIASMIGIWGSSTDAVPSIDEDDRNKAAPWLDQSDVDRFLDMESSAPASSALPPLPSVTLDGDLAFLPESPKHLAPTSESAAAPAETAPVEALAAVATLAESTVAEEIVAEASVAEAVVPEDMLAEASETVAGAEPAAEPVPASFETDTVAEEPEGDPREPETRDLTFLAAAEPAAPVTEPEAEDDLATAFPDLDSLSIEEKIALFA